MKQKLVRMKSVDGIELPGILYTPGDEKNNKVVIHVHGMSGNFYENGFIDELAEGYINKGYSFLTFNNRGKDYITEMVKDDGYVILGSCLESFEDCILDIEGVVNWAKSIGYSEIILEGHSYGCNKVIYYYDKKKDDSIKKIILLAPCDIPKEIELYTGEDYESCISKSKELVESGKEMELIDFPVFANGKVSANTFYKDFLYESDCDFFRYRDLAYKSKILNKIEIPVLTVFGDKDECVLTQPLDIVEKYLRDNIKNCDVLIIENTDHSYTGKYKELAELIEENI